MMRKQSVGDRKQTEAHREILFADPGLLADLARRGLVRVNSCRLAAAAAVSRQTADRWLEGVSVRPEADRALKRVCGLA